QFGGDESRFDRFADTDVVCDEQPDGLLAQRHQQRHELVGARVDGQLGERAERPGARAETDAQRGPQQAGRALVAQVVRSGRREARHLDLLQRGKHADEVVLRAAEGTQHQQFGVRTGLHYPFAATRPNQYTWGKLGGLWRVDAHVGGPFRGCRAAYSSPGPKMLRLAATVACQSPSWRNLITCQPASISRSSASSSRVLTCSSSWAGPSTNTATWA